MATILVTGASRGLGLEFVRQFRADGDRVIGTVRKEADAEAPRKLGAEIHLLDMRDGDGIAVLGKQLAGTPIDILIANAGIYEGRDTTLDEISEQVWIDTFRVNSVAPMLVARAFRDHVKAGRQRKMIAISSGFASISTNTKLGHYAYRSSKAALNAGWHALALAEPELIFIAMRPGWVRTAMGRPEAPLSPEESVTGMRRVIARATQADSGKFLGYDGTEIAW
ncbi:MAG: SDR family oxidoreductase [Alphaproteobacteria bacterium]|nr:SDR family oxidoreductase [Alphaproteobacteria bacterium]